MGIFTRLGAILGLAPGGAAEGVGGLAVTAAFPGPCLDTCLLLHRPQPLVACHPPSAEEQSCLVKSSRLCG